MMLYPYRFSVTAPCMFMVASTTPTTSPNTATAAYSSPSVLAKPMAGRVRQTSGCATRSTVALPNLAASGPAATLPTPAITGTISSTMVSCPLDRWNLSCSTDTRVTTTAKQRPWMKNAAAVAARPRRSRSPRGPAPSRFICRSLVSPRDRPSRPEAGGVPRQARDQADRRQGRISSVG